MARKKKKIRIIKVKDLFLTLRIGSPRRVRFTRAVAKLTSISPLATKGQKKASREFLALTTPKGKLKQQPKGTKLKFLF